MEVSFSFTLQVFLLSMVFIHKMMGLYQKRLLGGINECKMSQEDGDHDKILRSFVISRSVMQ
jgi:hypothetical protein